MTTEDFIKDNPQYFKDELDKWLYREFDILGGAQSSIESMKYHIAREVAEKAMEYARQQPVSDDLEEAYKKYADDRLVILRPDIADMSCDRETRMSQEVFDGSELEAAFYEGAHWMKTKLMKDAVECDVVADKDGFYTTETWDEMNDLLRKINAKNGDKVNLVIIKD